MTEVYHTENNISVQPKPKKKVFVTGCFDMLHSGHIAFLQEAASYGDLYVSIGADENVYNLKGRYPVNTQDERKYMIDALACVKKCIVNSGWGYIDFEKEILYALLFILSVTLHCVPTHQISLAAPRARHLRSSKLR